MSRNYRSRSLVLGFSTAFALTLLAPLAVTAEEDATAQISLAAPDVAGTSGEDLRTIRALVAQRALKSGDIGSLQEERLLAIVAAAPSWDETSGYSSVEANRARAAQEALQSQDLGSLQEDALFAIVTAGSSWDQTSGYASVEATRAAMEHPATSANDEAVRLAQFRAIERSLSRDLGAEHQEASSCDGVD
jgi:hypothetical protein